MKKIIFVKMFMLLVLMLSCNIKDKNQNLSFFDFDELNYYQKKITNNDLIIEDKKRKTESNYNSVYFKIVEGGYPARINNTLSNELIKFGFKEKIVSKSKYLDINNFFNKNNCNNMISSGCIPIYSDILIFKKKGKTIGIAKICFRCETAFIIGTKNLDYYGECSDYSSLQKILN